MTIKRISLAVMVAAVCGASYVAVASGDGDQPAPASAPAAAPSADLAQSYAVFRRAAGAGDAIPAGTARVLSSVTEPAGVSLEGARAVAPSGAGAVWAIPGHDKVCLAIPDPVDGFGMNCWTGEEIAAGKAAVGLVGMAGQGVGDARLAVLLPDGVTAATAISATGERQRMAVADNVAFGDVNVASVEYVDADRTVRVEARGTPADLVRGKG